ncbi:MAG: hypothetical protein ACK4V6_05900 [Microthrixaceae bacterium]
MPFEKCAPAASTAHAEWIVDALRGRDDVVGSVVPSGFDRCVRVHHALEDGRWSEVAPQFLVRGTETYEYPYGDDLGCADMGEDVVDPAGGAPRRVERRRRSRSLRALDRPG